MPFSSLVFLNLFLPAVAGVHFLLPGKPQVRNGFLLAASLLFYAWGEPVRIAYLLFVILLSHLGAVAVLKMPSGGKRKVLAATVIGILLLGLVHYKYSGFLARNFTALTGIEIHVDPIALPLGISFFTFQAISLVVDVLRGTAALPQSVFETALYIALFPKLAAGPIVKYRDFAEQIGARETSLASAADGLRRFVVGLAKKVLLANQLGVVADSVFALPADALVASHAWIGALFYSLQLFFDFSGYSDMAIGLCAVFGFKIPENFDYPYLSRTISEFWRRWHISLSSWFRDYLYIPLGGNRVGKPRLAFNLFLVFLATGAWHGAEWTFVLWGVWHGLFVIVERFTFLGRPRATRIGNWLQHVYALAVVLFGWVLFRADGLREAGAIFSAMLGRSDAVSMDTGAALLPASKLVVLAVAVLCSAGAFRTVLVRKTAVGRALRDIWLVALFLASLISLGASSYSPFIYFQF